jgi:integrase
VAKVRDEVSEDEFDLDAALWTVPAERMKARVEHVVPLAPRAVAILREARAAYPRSEFVFPGTKPGLPLSDMTLTKVLRDAGLNGKATARQLSEWSGRTESGDREKCATKRRRITPADIATDVCGSHLNNRNKWIAAATVD